MKPAHEPNETVRYAVVGAGWFGQSAVLPAFEHARRNSRLALIVSGDPVKRAELSHAYQVPAIPYAELDAALAEGVVDAIYVATPNTEHAEPAILAASHGVHVLCEKPLAESAVAADRIVAACDVADVRLMTAYRLHFEPANLAAVELVREGAIGEPRFLLATYTQQVADDNIRLDPTHGGHPLLDLGVYCINAARYLFRNEPIEVHGFEVGRKGSKAGGVPDLVGAVLKFPGNRLANIVCGFGQAKVSHFRLVGERGDIELNPAFSSTGSRTLTLTAGDDVRESEFEAVDQVAPEIEYFSDCILSGTTPEPDGREGAIDLRIIDAIRKSATEGRAVLLQPVADKARPDVRQRRVRPPVDEPELVHAAAPSE